MLYEVKEHRARGECLGAECRRKTQQAAKSRGEEQASIDPRISEWGNLHRATCEPFKKAATGRSETSQYPEEKKS